MTYTEANIINFMRACEPRFEIDLLETSREEFKLCKKYGFKSTTLIQYDVMLKEDMLSLIEEYHDEKMEIGVWIEIVKPLVQACNLEWRGRADWDLDWHVIPGFLMAYTKSERELLIDEIFNKFKSIYGYFPSSVGSWLLDSYSMDYMTKKYDVKAYCICREQDNTDAYTLWGGIPSGGYFPSKKNMISPAVDMDNAIKTPVFRMLTPDPIYNYRGSVVPEREGLKRTFTLEPCWSSGQTKDVIDWYFKTYTSPDNIGFSYMQIGQENSFRWEDVKKGLPYQMEVLNSYVKEGKITVKTLKETGVDFKNRYKETPIQCTAAMTNWDYQDIKSIWYSSKYYRCNVLFDKGKLSIRDLHVFKDGFVEDYYETPCDSWKAGYYTPIVCDTWLLLDEGRSGDYSMGCHCEKLDIENDNENLKIKAIIDGNDANVYLSEKSIKIQGVDVNFECKNDFKENIKLDGKKLLLSFKDYKYAINVDADLIFTDCGYKLCGDSITIGVN